MIQQHCYTRAQRGLFRQSEGYDTVARSDGLTEAFIKERLHPFCYYHPSRILQAKRVPAAEFPRAFTVVQFPEGSTLIGQTVYVETDFTGQRPTFFTHNYVMPQAEAGSFAPCLLKRLYFFTESDWDQLPELDTLPMNDGEANVADEPGPLPFDEARLLQLVDAIADAVSGSRKVYVAFPSSCWIFPVLTWLYDRLPEDVLQVLGFTTFSREPVNKKFLHLIFMDKGCMGDVRSEWDYVFDFNTGRFQIPEKLEERPEPEAEIEPPKETTLEKIARIFGVGK